MPVNPVQRVVTDIGHGALRFARRPTHQRCACATLQSAWADDVYELGLTKPILEDLLEMKSNLATLGERLKRQWLAEGKAKGRAEGKAEGKAEALACLLAQRFGALTPSLQTRIREAKATTVEHWFKRAIDAPDLPSIFDSTA